MLAMNCILACNQCSVETWNLEFMLALAQFDLNSNPVTSVIMKLNNRVVFRYIFSLNMKVLSILVINVIIKLLIRMFFRDTISQNITCIHGSNTSA